MAKNKILAVVLLPLVTWAWANTPLPDFAPPAQGQQVVINIPQLRLFLYQDGQLLHSYPVAVGKNATRTPLGEYKIGAKAYNPAWHVPKSIQREMVAKGQAVQTVVPAGPKNPLGPVFVRLGDPKLGLGIHGTNAPSSVPGVRSHGCVRMQSPNALAFAKAVHSGADAAVVYQLASLNVDVDQQLWLAAYRDPYVQKNLDTEALHQSMNQWAKAHGLNINQPRVTNVLKQRHGRLVCITCPSVQAKVKGPLAALTWQTGVGELVTPKPVYVEPEVLPTPDDVLPDGSAVEALTDPIPPSGVHAVPVAPPSPEPPGQLLEPTPLSPEEAILRQLL